jgi:hypothetical protein
MSDAATARSPAGMLLLAVVTGLALRLPGLFWGYGLAGEHQPYVQLHPDEPRFVEMARGLKDGGEFRRSYVLGLGQLLRLTLAAAERMGRPLADDQLVVVARIISLLAGLGLILVVVGLVRAVGGSTTAAALAAWLIALNPLCIHHSHFGTSDMLFTLLLYGFAAVTLRFFRRPSLLALAGVGVLAGLAMAVKFGLTVVPALLLLPLAWPGRRVAALLLVVMVAALVFWVAQGGAFTAESASAIWAGLTVDNLGSFHHVIWMNPVVYGAQAVRVLGLIGAGVLAAGLVTRRWEMDSTRWPLALAFFPVLLHGVFMNGLHLPFPRHLLPVIPLLILVLSVAAADWLRLKAWMLAVLLGWTALLGVTDALPFWREPRSLAVNWMAREVSQDKSIWPSPYIRLPLTLFYRAAPLEKADFIIQHEAWFYRFGRSELSPLGSPPPDASIYHAATRDREQHLQIQEWIEAGLVRQALSAQSPLLLPEQFLYRKWLGNLEKFSGQVVILERISRDAEP